MVGGANYDLTVRMIKLPSVGMTVLADDMAESVGGKASNQAVAASLWGADVALVARVGQDAYGDAILRSLDAAGVDTTSVRRDSSGSGLGIVFMDASGQYETAVVSRANRNLAEADIENLDLDWGNIGVVVLQLESPVDAVVAAAEAARRRGAWVVLNASPSDRASEALLRMVDYLVVNEAEAAELSGVFVETRADAKAAAERLTGFCTHVVVTLGSAGVVCISRDGSSVDLAGQSVDAVDTLGAGDQFLGVLAAELAVGSDLRRALESANWAASQSVTKHGAQASYVNRRSGD